MAGNQIRVAVWEYRNEAGKRRIAYFGDSVELTPDEYDRAEKAGVFDVVLPVKDADEDSVLTADPTDDAPVPKTVPRPAKAHAKELWVEYAVSKGWDRDRAAAMKKNDLMAALTSDDDGDDQADEPVVPVDDPATDPSDDPDEIEVPKKAGLLEDWQAYARAKGLPDEDIEGLDKQELIELLT